MKSIYFHSSILSSLSTKRRRDIEYDEVSPSKRTFKYYSVSSSITKDNENLLKSSVLVGNLLHSGDMLILTYNKQHLNEKEYNYQLFLHPNLVENIDVSHTNHGVTSVGKKSFDGAQLIHSYSTNGSLFCPNLRDISSLYEHHNGSKLLAVLFPSKDTGSVTLIIVSIPFHFDEMNDGNQNQNNDQDQNQNQNHHNNNNNSNSDKSQYQISKHQIVLHGEMELVSYITFIGQNKILVGSSLNHVYIISLDNTHRVLSADILQPQQNVSWLYSFIQTASQLLGIQTTTKYKHSSKHSSLSSMSSSFPMILKLIPILSYQTCFILSSHSIQIWSSTVTESFGSITSMGSIGKEVILHELDILPIIKEEILRLGVVTQSILLTDMIILPPDHSIDQIYVLVLFISVSTNMDGENTYGLWLSSLTSSFTFSSDTSSPSGPMEVNINVTTTILVDGDILLSNHHPKPCYLSSTSISDPSSNLNNRFYIVWTSALLESLQCAYIDGLNIALAIEPNHTIDSIISRSIPKLVSEDSRVLGKDVLSVSLFDHIHAVCIVKKDGVIFLCSPEVQGHPINRLKTGVDLLRPLTLLLGLAKGELNAHHMVESVVTHMKTLVDEQIIYQVCQILVTNHIDDNNSNSNSGINTDDKEISTNIKVSSGIPTAKATLIRSDLDTKINYILKLIQVLEDWEWELYIFPAYRMYQSLSFRRSLYLLIQDIQSRVQHITSPNMDLIEKRGYKIRLLDAAYRGGFDTWTEAILRTVLEYKKYTQEEIKQKGLTPSEVFFVQSDYEDIGSLLEILLLVLDDIESIEISSPSLSSHIYGSIMIIVNVFNDLLNHFDLKYKNSEMIFLCDIKVRQCFIRLIQRLQSILEKRIETSQGLLLDPILDLIDDGLKNVRDSKLILQQLCHHTLHSYKLEAISAGSLSEDDDIVLLAFSGQHMSIPWRESYENVKAIVRNLLCTLNYHNIAFHLSIEFLDYIGILTTFDILSKSNPTFYKNKLLDTIDTYGDIYGTNEMTLGMFALIWLEEHQYPTSFIFEVGMHCSNQLDEFLESRPHLSWLYQLEQRKYHQAATSAILHGQKIDVVEQATTVFSIAKLAARLASQSDNDQDIENANVNNNNNSNTMVNRISTKRSLEENDEKLMGKEELTMRTSSDLFIVEADRHLSILKAQAFIQQTAPEFFPKDKDNRISPLQLISILITVMNRAYEEKGCILSETDIQLFSRLIVIGLSILTMIDAYESREEVDKLVVKLWTTSLTIQSTLWLEISNRTEIDTMLGIEDEERIRNSLYVIALALSRSEAVTMSRGEPFPTDLNSLFIPIVSNEIVSETSNGTEELLLENIIKESELSSLVFDNETGEVRRDTNHLNKNDRIIYLVRIATNMTMTMNE